MSKRKTINNRFCEAKSAEYEKTEQVYLAKVCDIRTDGIEKNLQGDVVAVYNDLGQLLISYKYTAYGEFWMSASNNGFNTKAASNPFTYRGYYFDSDLNLYYLGSRYYDYNTCRFINADNALYHHMIGYNMFAYCYNNPVNYYDPEGAFALAIGAGAYVLAAFVKALIVTVATIVVADAVVQVVDVVDEAIEDRKTNESAQDPPKNVENSSNKEEAEKSEADDSVQDYTPSNPGMMNEEIKRGQAPKDLKSAHQKHTNNGRPHVHFKNGTSMNNDGSIHDAHKGIPKLSNKVKKWLDKHNWSTEVKIFKK